MRAVERVDGSRGPAAMHVLFDFFGTLVEYSPSLTDQGYQRSHSVLRAAGIELSYAEFLKRWVEVAGQFETAAQRTHREFSMLELASDFVRQMSHPNPRGLARELAASYLSEWNTGVRYLDGIAPMLERLARRCTPAIVTNTHDADLVPQHLQRMGIAPLFGTVVTSVELGVRKPAPQIFRHALEMIGAAPEQCLFVGDSYEADFCGARAAGIPALLIDPTSAAPIAAADRLASITELESRLERIWST